METRSVKLKRRWRLVQPGETVEMDATEAARIVALDGAEYVTAAIPAAPVTAAVVAAQPRTMTPPHGARRK